MRAEVRTWVERILRQTQRSDRAALLQRCPWHLRQRVELEVRARWKNRHQHHERDRYYA